VASDSGDESVNESSTNLSSDELFDLLSHHRRRYVIECLDRYGSPMSLPDLADECVVMEHRKAFDDIPGETVKRMYMSLYHTHIPRLVESRVVEYDQESDSVALGPNAARLEPHVTLACSRLSTPASNALSELRSSIDTGDGLSIDRTRTVLQRAGYSDDEISDVIDRLEDRGYIYILNGRVRLTE
jgi:hypothetical protein